LAVSLEQFWSDSDFHHLWCERIFEPLNPILGFIFEPLTQNSKVQPVGLFLTTIRGSNHKLGLFGIVMSGKLKTIHISLPIGLLNRLKINSGYKFNHSREEADSCITLGNTAT